MAPPQVATNATTPPPATDVTHTIQYYGHDHNRNDEVTVPVCLIVAHEDPSRRIVLCQALQFSRHLALFLTECRGVTQAAIACRTFVVDRRTGALVTHTPLRLYEILRIMQTSASLPPQTRHSWLVSSLTICSEMELATAVPVMHKDPIVPVRDTHAHTMPLPARHHAPRLNVKLFDAIKQPARGRRQRKK